MKKLIIGSGPGYQHQDGVVSVDYIPEFNPDIVADITEGIPVERGVFDEIEIHHTLEHIESNKDFKRIMNDMHDILAPGGTVDITVPYYKCPSAIETYEHCRFFNENSFMNFYENRYAKEMGIQLFERVTNEVRPYNGGQEVHVVLRKPL